LVGGDDRLEFDFTRNILSGFRIPECIQVDLKIDAIEKKKIEGALLCNRIGNNGIIKEVVHKRKEILTWTFEYGYQKVKNCPQDPYVDDWCIGQFH
jgi:hypothetical protein